MGLIHLYSATSTSFDNNGIPLVTAREAVVKRDEGFQLTFNIPISQNDLHKRVQKEMIVSAMTPDGVNYFRIWDIEKRTTDVKVTALQLLYSLDVKRINPFGGRQYTGDSVLRSFVSAFKSSISPYTFSSSITTSRDFYTNEKDDTSTSHNALAILNKIADNWSGELMLNGFDVRMISKLGTKTDALLYEHKNIASFSDSSSMNGIITRIYATAKYTPERAEGATEDPEPVVLTATVDSPLINKYAVIYEATMEYNDARTVAELRTEILKQYYEFNVDKPERTIDVDTNIVDGTAINFGDELVLKYLVHDVDEVIRCVGYEYDPISENYIGVTLGTLEKTFLTKVTEGISSSVSRQFDKINKQIQIVQTSANGKNRVTYGPNPVPNAIEGDLWFKHPEGRPDEVELLIYQNGLWLPAPFLTDLDKLAFEQELADYQSNTLAEIERKDAEYKTIFDAYDAKVLVIDQGIADSANKAQSALEEAGISTDLAQTAKDLAATAQSNANTARTNASAALTQAGQAITDSSTAITNAQTALDDAKTALITAGSAKSTADALTITVNNLEGEVELKASQTEVNGISGTVLTHTTTIGQHATAIASKASTSSVNTLTGRVSTAETTIGQHATAITSKASQSEVDMVKGTVSGHASTLSQHATAISARLTSSEVNSLVDGKGLAKTTYVDTQITAKAGEITTSITSLIGRTPSQGDNLIINGGFEQYVTGGDPVGWSGVTELHTHPHSGTRAIMLRALPASSKKMITHTSLIPVTPGRKYEYGYWIQSSTDANGTADNNKMRIGAETGALIHDLGTTGPINTGSTPWVLKTTTFVVPANVYNLTVSIVHNNTVGWYKYDDVYLRDISDLEDAKSYADTQISVKAGEITTSLTGLINGKVSQSDIDTSILNDKRIKDTRNNNQLPSWYNDNYPRQTVLEFKNTSAMGITGGSTYGLLTTEVIWIDTSGGTIKQTLKDNTDTYTRQSNTTYTAWGPWVKMADQTYVNTTVTTTANGIEQLITQVKTNPESTITGYNSLKNNVNSMVQAIGTDGGKVAQIVMTNSVYQTTVANQDIMSRAGTGLLLGSDPTFLKGLDGIVPYERSSGVVTIFRENAPTGTQPNGPYRLRIVSTGASGDIGAGGINKNTMSQTNREYLIKFTALLPKGRSFQHANNAMGDGYHARWLTSREGTGTWTEYAYYYKCGNTGTFSSFGHLYVIGNTALTWYLSKHEIFDITGTNQTQITQLADSYAMTITSRDVIKTQLNLTTGGVKIKGDLIHLSGNSLIDNAVIKSAMIDTLNVSKLTGTTAEFTALRANVITAGSITADRLVTGTALVDRVFVDTAAITRLTSKSAFINNIQAISIDVGKITGNTASFISAAFTALNSQSVVNGRAIRIQNTAGEFVEMNNAPELRSDDAGGTAVVLGRGRVQFYDSRGHAKGYVGTDMYTAGNYDFGTYLSKGTGIYRFARMADATQTTYAYYTVKANITSPSGIIDDMVRNGYLPDGNTQQFVAKGNMISQLNGWPNYPNWPALSAGQRIRYKELTTQTTGDAYDDIWKFGVSSQGDWRIYFAKHAIFQGGYTGTSDRRLKHDIKITQVEALYHIESLSFKEFKWNRDNKYEPIGLIAQDSGIIRVADEDMEGLDIQRAIMLGLKGTQELNMLVKEQAEEIKQLKEIINQ